MCRKNCCAHAILPLLAVLLILPIAVTVLFATAVVLHHGRRWRRLTLAYIALGAVIVWIIGLITLVLFQGLKIAKEAHCTCHGHSSAGFHGNSPAPCECHSSAEGEVGAESSAGE